MRRADLADLAAFVAVADSLSFRAAASRIGVTPSAVSHTMRHFEEPRPAVSPFALPASRSGVLYPQRG
jgi:hypothetical protein